jgi:hypothetical protein
MTKISKCCHCNLILYILNLVCKALDTNSSVFIQTTFPPPCDRLYQLHEPYRPTSYFSYPSNNHSPCLDLENAICGLVGLIVPRQRGVANSVSHYVHTLAMGQAVIGVFIISTCTRCLISYGYDAF